VAGAEAEPGQWLTLARCSLPCRRGAALGAADAHEPLLARELEHPPAVQTGRRRVLSAAADTAADPLQAEGRERRAVRDVRVLVAGDANTPDRMRHPRAARLEQRSLAAFADQGGVKDLRPLSLERGPLFDRGQSRHVVFVSRPVTDATVRNVRDADAGARDGRPCQKNGAIPTESCGAMADGVAELSPRARVGGTRRGMQSLGRRTRVPSRCPPTSSPRVEAEQLDLLDSSADPSRDGEPSLAPRRAGDVPVKPDVGLDWPLVSASTACLGARRLGV